MKKTIVLLATLFLLFVGAQKAQAVPYYYTFEGEVASYSDTAGIIALQTPSGFGVGSAVTYTIIIDFNIDGYYVYNSGVQNNATCYDTLYNECFYTDYYSGTNIWSINGGWFNGPLNVAEFNTGNDNLNYDTGTIDVLSGNDQLRIRTNTYSSLFSNLAVDDTEIRGRDEARDSDGTYSSINSSLTLTSISATAPGPPGALPFESVPEPATMLLLGSGLFAFGLFRRMRKEG